MLKYQTWYAVIWSAVVVLYYFGWSALNVSLEPTLLFFFILTIALSAFMAKMAPTVPWRRLKFVRRRPPVMTLILCTGFVADWAYRGSIPVLQPYQGYDPDLTIGTTVGIPVVHVIITAVGIYYTMYLGYLYLSDTSVKSYLCEYITMLFMFLLNNSRGYIVFILFVTIILYAALNNKGLSGTKVSSVFLIAVAGLLVIFFVSAMGNIRSGYGWNDCSFIETIGIYNAYPSWLTKHFMWFYSYATSPLANLNLNCELFNGTIDIKALIFSFLPEQLSNSVLVSASTPYVTSYFTAETGFATFARAAGAFGPYISFLGMIVYYSAVKAFLKKYNALETFGNAVLCFLIVVAIFYSAFTTSSVCYMPLLLLIHSMLLAKKMEFAPAGSKSSKRISRLRLSQGYWESKRRIPTEATNAR